ncbi:hypothetical protein M378DRAFT_155849 [Amanita muscaria Koide BX008]|uniref:Uncharacterized protein n=1 Tax=Amanita muscaria (strain Koide BX008) TaxID=946122 RepID=A0A0C2XMV5_AMAMK|nr:hypothetical protein M378DRAFT_155849 [Amanita muscaria Koide BX008]
MFTVRLFLNVRSNLDAEAASSSTCGLNSCDHFLVIASISLSSSYRQQLSPITVKYRL